MTGKDRKSFTDCADYANASGLRLCMIYDPGFKHWFIEFRAPEDEGEVMAQAIGDLGPACATAVETAKRVLALMGLEKYEYVENHKTPPLIVAP